MRGSDTDTLQEIIEALKVFDADENGTLTK